jgi:hypothetical protein
MKMADRFARSGEYLLCIAGCFAGVADRFAQFAAV